MNFLAHCLIALKAGEASAKWSRQGAEQRCAATTPEPRTGEPAGECVHAGRIDGDGFATAHSKPSEDSFPALEARNFPATGNPKGLGMTTGLTDGLVAGGLLGDFIKGPVPCAWPGALQLGVRLHRRIDAFSNAAPGIKRSCNRFPPKLRRLAPIFVDIIADHCLALDWADHHHEALPAFSARCYGLAAAEAHRLDENGRRYLNWVIDQDLMAGYRNYDLMERGLRSVTRRLALQHLDASLLDFVAGELPRLREHFQGYFPALVEHGRGYVQAEVSKPS